jgi:intergrase/recombinase
MELSLFAKREPSLRENLAAVDWVAFEAWLSNGRRRNVVADRLSYAKRYVHCLVGNNLSELQTLSEDKRCHVLRALSCLAKYAGVYDDFRALKSAYGLKWTGRSSDDLLIDRLTRVTDPDEMFSWIRQVKTAFPLFATFMDFMAATGLRYEEAINSWNLIIELNGQGKLGTYYSGEKRVLEHFRFRETFIRRTKKAFVSFVSEDLLKEIAEQRSLTKPQITKRLQRARLKLRFGDIREFQGTLLTRYLKQEEIDFIHGRVSGNVFMRNYFNPAWISDLQERTLKAANAILAKIS